MAVQLQQKQFYSIDPTSSSSYLRSVPFCANLLSIIFGMRRLMLSRRTFDDKKSRKIDEKQQRRTDTTKTYISMCTQVLFNTCIPTGISTSHHSVFKILADNGIQHDISNLDANLSGITKQHKFQVIKYSQLHYESKALYAMNCFLRNKKVYIQVYIFGNFLTIYLLPLTYDLFCFGKNLRSLQLAIQLPTYLPTQVGRQAGSKLKRLKACHYISDCAIFYSAVVKFGSQLQRRRQRRQREVEMSIFYFILIFYSPEQKHESCRKKDVSILLK